jgi:hypothetical protein
MSVSPKEVREQLAMVRNPDAVEGAKAFEPSSDPLSFHGSGPIVTALLKARGEIRGSVTIDSLLDASFVRAAPLR